MEINVACKLHSREDSFIVSMNKINLRFTVRNSSNLSLLKEIFHCRNWNKLITFNKQLKILERETEITFWQKLEN